MSPEEKTLTIEEEARNKFYFLDTINQFVRLINLGSFPGKEVKSVIKMHEYLKQLWDETQTSIETNSWYVQEKAAMEALSMKSVMANGSGEYDPNYKVTMPDVFRKQAK